MNKKQVIFNLNSVALTPHLGSVLKLNNCNSREKKTKIWMSPNEYKVVNVWTKIDRDRQSYTQTDR